MLPTRTKVPGAAMGSRSHSAHGIAVEGAPDAEAMSPAAVAQGICLRLLTARPRSRAELTDALRRRGIPEEVGKPVLDRLSQLGLVDDAAFAEAAVYSGHSHRGLGRRTLSTELRVGECRMRSPARPWRRYDPRMRSSGPANWSGASYAAALCGTRAPWRAD